MQKADLIANMGYLDLGLGSSDEDDDESTVAGSLDADKDDGLG